MQLNNKSKPVRHSLTLATATLLGSVSAPGYGAASNDWEIDSSVLYYAEDGRVSAIEPVVRARKTIGDDEFLTFRLVVDSLTGSSANGAIATTAAQTFTKPSGDATYTTAANTTPLDPSFHDTRVAVNGEWEKPLQDNLKGIFGANLSKEYDYTSLGASATLAWDFNSRNTTFTTGLSLNLDTVKPVGGIPDGLTAMPTTTTFTKASVGDSDNKTVVDVLLGITQVIGRKTLMQFNYTYGQDDGYLTDPYKILSVVTDAGTATLAATPYLYEQRPDSRVRNAFYWKTVHQFEQDVVNFSYRYYWDDWGITSHTFDARYRYELGGGHYLMPHARYYLQDKADFYHYKLVDGDIPRYASADYRLGDLSTTTLGLKYGVELSENSEFSVRAEIMKQQSRGSGATFPDVDAMILQANYSFLF